MRFIGKKTATISKIISRITQFISCSVGDVISEFTEKSCCGGFKKTLQVQYGAKSSRMCQILKVFTKSAAVLQRWDLTVQDLFPLHEKCNNYKRNLIN